ncbi:uncharacterized protein C10orf143 homolog [Erinaceus europaeus]|uniref:Uncharacterized protein C10orf143 homolog n=1 Tax=Erinaceus europaeus TaxID=9365 RepID=A0ABM3VRW2_ERIEU|nr:uncharacterized protein C10orf143 homolog [Erinaceus europaeus]
MDTLLLGRWRRRKPEELQLPGDAKRACRRPDGATPPWDCPQVTWSPEEKHGHPAPRPESNGGLARSGALGSGGGSPAQPCPRCLAGESGHFSHAETR